MLKTLRLKYFQSHKNSKLHFHPGFNVITGESDRGKSSIIRAIRLVVEGKPVRTDNFLSDFAPKQSISSIGMFFDEGVVVREKGKGVNRFSTKTDKFDAVRSEIPAEISAITRMSEVNIQTQHNPYFLFEESAGSVSKKFNSLSGLQEIDLSLKTVNDRIKTAESDITEFKESVEQSEISLRNYDWIPKLEGKILRLRSISDKHEEVNGKVVRLDILLNKIKELQTSKDSLPKINVPNLKPYKGILQKIDGLDSSLLFVNNYGSKLTNVKRVLAKLKSLPGVAKSAETLKTAVTRGKLLSKLVALAQSHQTSLDVKTKKIKEATTATKKKWAEYKLCPLCRNKL